MGRGNCTELLDKVRVVVLCRQGMRVLHGTGDPELKEKNGISTAGPVDKVGGITTINQPQEQNGATGICGYG